MAENALGFNHGAAARSSLGWLGCTLLVALGQVVDLLQALSARFRDPRQALLELLARSPRFKQANANAGFILAFAVPTALFAVLVLASRRLLRPAVA